MSMNTYPFEEKAALAVSSDMAAAIILADMWANDRDALPQGLKAAFEGGVPAWQIVRDASSEQKAWLDENDCYDISDAHDVLSRADIQNLVHCSEFQGDAQCADGFENIPGGLAASGDWDDDFVCFVTPEKSGGLFKAAYASPEELIEEYRKKLEPWLGAGFCYAMNIMDVSGTYFC